MDALADLPDDVRLEVYDAVIRYGISGETKDLKPMARLAFAFVKNDIDTDKAAYAKKVEAGKTGGRPKLETKGNQEKPTETNENQKKPKETKKNQEKPTEGDGFVCSGDNVIYSVISCDNVIEEKEPKGSKKKAAEAAAIKIKEAAKKLTDEVYATDYSDRIKYAFCNYWLEPNPSRTKLRYQLEKTWDTERRLATWAAREKPGEPKASEIGRQSFTRNYEETW